MSDSNNLLIQLLLWYIVAVARDPGSFCACYVPSGTVALLLYTAWPSLEITIANKISMNGFGAT